MTTINAGPMAGLLDIVKLDGLGTCEIHGCNLWGSQKPVFSYKDDKARREKQGRFIDVVVCPECQRELQKIRLKDMGINTGEILNQAETALEKFKSQKGVDLKKDVIVKFDYTDELSYVNTTNMIDWIKLNLSRALKIKMIDPTKYLELRKNRFMGDEQKQRYAKYSYEAETADLIILNSLAEFGDNDSEDIYNLLYRTKDTAALMILTIPESDYRLNSMPTKLKYRLKAAQIMQISSTGKGR